MRVCVAMHSPYVSDPVLGPDRAVQVSAWAEAHGLAPGAVVSADSFVLNIDSQKRSNGPGKNITGGYLSAGALVEVMRRCDAAVFLSRAEGGTNLMAMEAMAVGVPVIISNNTGHRDIVRGEHCFPLAQTYPAGEGAERHWGESNVGDIVAALRRVWADPEEARAKGKRAAQFIREQYTWAVALEGMLQSLQSGLEDP